MYEVLLTRIFSVTMWYHFAFVAISVALFGMTVGALIVYLLPDRFPQEDQRPTNSVLAAFQHIDCADLPDSAVHTLRARWSVAGVSITLLYLVASFPIFGGYASVWPD
jgi:hypothetical protein